MLRCFIIGKYENECLTPPVRQPHPADISSPTVQKYSLSFPACASASSQLRCRWSGRTAWNSTGFWCVGRWLVGRSVILPFSFPVVYTRSLGWGLLIYRTLNKILWVDSDGWTSHVWFCHISNKSWDFLSLDGRMETFLVNYCLPMTLLQPFVDPLLWFFYGEGLRRMFFIRAVVVLDCC